MKIRAGYKTSEFWLTVVTFIFSGLYLTGILTENDQKEELIQIVSHGVESCILIGGQLIILYRYIKGRNEIKKIAEQEKLEEIKRNVSKRTSNKPSRKNNTRTTTKTTKPKKNSAK